MSELRLDLLVDQLLFIDRSFLMLIEINMILQSCWPSVLGQVKVNLLMEVRLNLVDEDCHVVLLSVRFRLLIDENTRDVPRMLPFDIDII